MARRLAAAVTVLCGLALAPALAQSPDLPHRPQEVDLDDARCAQCEMRIASPRHLSQLQTKDGRVLSFDDAGCLLRYLQAKRPRVHARYFRGPDGRWIRGRDVAFATGGRTPMGYGLAAVRAGTPGAVSWDEAWRRVAERHRARR